MNLFLIGYRCTGKTSVGRRLAEALGLRFVDADQMLTAERKESVARIVARGGWPLFRRLEKEVLSRICAEDGQVVATGGGAVLDEDNRRLMRQRGMVIWLQAAPDEICDRMCRDAATADQRPALAEKSALCEVTEILGERTALYAATMHAAVETTQKTMDAVCSEILCLLQQKDAGGTPS